MDSLATASSASPSAAAASAAKPPSKRRVVKIADDADIVLAKCHKLRDELRKKQMKKQQSTTADDSSDDDEWGLDDLSDIGTKKKSIKTDIDNTKSGDTKKTKTQQLSLAELQSKKSSDGGKSIVEVVEMNSTEVMEGIENVAVKIAHQVLAKQGFQLDIPCELPILYGFGFNMLCLYFHW